MVYLQDFYELWPKKFQYKTNGVTQVMVFIILYVDINQMVILESNNVIMAQLKNYDMKRTSTSDWILLLVSIYDSDAYSSRVLLFNLFMILFI